MLPKSNKIFVKPDKQHSNTYDTCSVTFGLRYRARLAKCMSTLDEETWPRQHVSSTLPIIDFLLSNYIVKRLNKCLKM